jgi:protein disulfide-isomerase A1
MAFSKSWLLCLLGFLIVSQQCIQLARAEEAAADDDAGEYEDDEVPEAAPEPPVVEKSDKNVLVLGKSNFDKTVKGHKYVLAEFYAPWCGHCKKLEPEYAEAATILKGSDADVVLAKIDATEEKDLAQEYGVSGYPTLFWFVDGVKTDYKGGRTSGEIVSWIKKKTGPPAATLTTKKELIDVLEVETAVAVGFFEKFEGPEWEAFQAAARAIDDVAFVQTTEKVVADEAAVKGSAPAIVLLKDEEEKLLQYGGKYAAADLTDFVSKNKLPLVVAFSQQTGPLIFQSPVKKQAFIFVEGSGDKALKEAQEVAKEYKGEVTFVSVDVSGQEAGQLVEYFGAKGQKYPFVVGYDSVKTKKYQLQDKFSKSALKTFASGFVKETLTPFYKSEPIPETAEDNGVTVVVGKNFDSVVLDDSKDVLLEVYAPWCGHCKALAPTWEKLAKRFRSVDSVVIAKMDGTANEHEKVNVRGFPTLLFFPAGAKGSPLAVETSDRTVKAFTEYIKEHANIPFELKKKEKKKEESIEKEVSAEEGVKKDEL